MDSKWDARASYDTRRWKTKTLVSAPSMFYEPLNILEKVHVEGYWVEAIH